MTFTYSLIHKCGSEIDPGGISHLILSSLLRSFHLWLLSVAQPSKYSLIHLLFNTTLECYPKLSGKYMHMKHTDFSLLPDWK